MADFAQLWTSIREETMFGLARLEGIHLGGIAALFSQIK
jgi:hypothetical protein